VAHRIELDCQALAQEDYVIVEAIEGLRDKAAGFRVSGELADRVALFHDLQSQPLWAEFISGLRLRKAGAVVRVEYDVRRPEIVGQCTAGAFRVAVSRLEQALTAHLRVAIIAALPPDARSAPAPVVASSELPWRKDQSFWLTPGPAASVLLAATFGPLFAARIGIGGERIAKVGFLYRPPQNPELVEELRRSVDGDGPGTVLITGLPRTGKSYTALYHLFLNFVAGCEVAVALLAAPLNELDTLYRDLEQRYGPPAEQAPARNRPLWVYLEDPFGTAEFAGSHRVDEVVTRVNKFRELGARVLVTTRDGIWSRVTEEAKRRSGEGKGDRLAPLKECVISLNSWWKHKNIGETYSPDTLAEMVVGYAALAGAKWVIDPSLREKVSEQVATLLKEGTTIHPADIVVWSSLLESHKDPEGYLPWLRDSSDLTADFVRDLRTLVKSQGQRMALMLPQILFISQEDGEDLADALRIRPEWNATRQLRQLMPSKIARHTHSPLRHYQLYQPDWADGVSRYARSWRGLGDLSGYLEAALAAPKPFAGVNPYLVIELIRFRTLVSAGLPERPPCWLTDERVKAIRDLVRRPPSPPVQQERSLCLLETLLTVERAGTERGDEAWGYLQRQLRNSANPILLAAAGHGLGDVVRVRSSPGVLGKGFAELVRSLVAPAHEADADLGPAASPFVAAMTTSLVVGSVFEPFGEHPAVDKVLKRELGGVFPTEWSGKLGDRRVLDAPLAVWLTWSDILVWKVGDAIRFLADRTLRDSLIDPDHVLGALNWMITQLAKQSRLVAKDAPDLRQQYCLGWMLFTLLWHNDWAFLREDRESPHGKRMANAARSMEKRWRAAYRAFCRPSSEGRSVLLDGFFDNAAYHAAYHQFQATEWAQRTAVRPTAREMVRIGSRTHHESGVTGENAVEAVALQMDDVWSRALCEAERRFAGGSDATWRDDSRPGPASSLMSPGGCLHALASLLGIRLADQFGRPGKEGSTLHKFHTWFLGRLSPTGPAVERRAQQEAWEVVLDLLWQGFDPFVAERRFDPSLEPAVLNQWVAKAKGLGDLMPSPAFRQHVDLRLKQLFTARSPDEQRSEHAE
jgi:hypothetical protein